MPYKTLVFVYNASSGTISSLIDSARKIISPDTYDCQLCKLTHDAFKENVLWSRFCESVTNNNPSIKLEFLHKNEFDKQYWSKWLPKYTFPIILGITEEEQDYNDGFGTNSGMEIVLNTDDINQLLLTEELITAIQQKLKE
jgi:hypothetical protein